MGKYRSNEWSRLVGEKVEIRKPGTPPLNGLVDAATSDNSVLWLVQHGIEARKMVEATEGYVVWLEPQQYFTHCQPYEQDLPYFLALAESDVGECPPG